MRAPTEQHQMILQGTDSAGTEEWLCAECGRHFIARWSPHFEQLILIEGDGRAGHYGSKGDVSIGRMRVSVSDVGLSAAAEDPWRQWLRRHGIDGDDDPDIA
ncbi:MAG: hypothetical protein ACRDSF_22400 [Pseudonocardiaceae bacterium]